MPIRTAPGKLHGTTARLAPHHRASWLFTAVLALIPALCTGAETYDDRDTQAWIADLASDDVEVRWYATHALAQIGSPAADAVAPLKDLLADRAQYEYVRAGAAFALGHIGANADLVVPLLAETLASDLASVRRNSARALARFGPQAESAVPQMAEQLKRDDPIFRVDLAEALWRVAEHKGAIPFLIRQIQQPDQPGAFEAAEALGRLAPNVPDQAVPTLIDALASQNDDIARSATRSLGRAGRAVLPRLVVALRSEDETLRRRATEAVVWMGEPGVTALIGALNDSAPAVRRAAARGLGRLGPLAAQAEPVLLRAVNDPDPHVRATAAQSLSAIGAKPD